MPAHDSFIETNLFWSICRGKRFCRLGLLLLVVIGLQACGTLKPHKTLVLGKNEQYAVVIAGSGETHANLAERFLGDPGQYWRIADANEGTQIKRGQTLVIPLQSPNVSGVYADGLQTVPLLSYHRFGAGKGKLSVARREFERQMEYLKQHDYRVIPLSQVQAFLRGEAAIPRRSVVLTIDDGYRSVYQIAYPVLKKYNYPATIFIYSDYIGNGGLTWSQMQEMEASGLISFQSHSKTHDNLTLRLPVESMDDYKARLVDEVRVPSEKLNQRMRHPTWSFAYPFGSVNQKVVDELKRSGYQMGVTVDRGANPFFTYPYTLRRIMIYESDGMPEFIEALQVYQDRNLK